LRPDQLPISLDDRRLTPGFLGAADHPWLCALLELVAAHDGASWRELDARLRRPVLDHVSLRRQRLAVDVLRRTLRGRVDAPLPPRRVRATVFGLAAAGRPRADVIEEAAQTLGIASEQIDRSLFADLPGERRVALGTIPSSADLAIAANLHLCQLLLARAVAVEIVLRGNARAVIRLAHLRGLICSVERGRAAGEDARLSLSGPLSLFRRTTLYGRALGSLLPTLAWCDSYRLTAKVALTEREAELRLDSGDLILPAAQRCRYDSRVEQRLAADLQRHATEWTVVREPEPLASGSSLVFPDFALLHQGDPRRRWLLEIIGFWTPDYLQRKVAQYRGAACDRLILCIDETLGAAADDLRNLPSVVPYRRTVPVDQVLAILRAKRPR
jgi:uncharacterized protein